MIGDLAAPVVNAYCERGADPSFWAEPVNALTNAAFLIAGAAALRRHRGDPAAVLLAATTIVIGIGSFLFHSFATRAAMLADVIPIQAFIAIYFFLAMRRFLGLGAIAAGAATLGFMVAAAAAPAALPATDPWRGLGGYVGGLAGLAGLGAWLVFDGRRGNAGVSLLVIGGLFAVSLTFRTLDKPVCHLVAIGTHPLWHCLNTVVLYALIDLLARARPDFDRIRQ